MKTLERQFPTAKQKPPIEEQKNVIYQIPCQDCSWSYIGETGRSLKTRKSEHIRNVKLSKKGSNVAKHAWTQDHIIDFDLMNIEIKCTCTENKTTLLRRDNKIHCNKHKKGTKKNDLINGLSLAIKIRA